MTHIQEGFFQLLKNCHHVDPPFKVLTWISWLVGGVAIEREEEDKYDIWKEGSILFTGSYEQLLDDLFHYIFDKQD